MSEKRMKMSTETILGHDFLLPLDSMSASEQDPTSNGEIRGLLGRDLKKICRQNVKNGAMFTRCKEKASIPTV